MAVISELIDIGLKLKAQGKLKAAIEHFRQLRATYPDNSRIMYELAVCWSALDVPEQALPLYQTLLKLPRAQGLPARDRPRLYTRLGATLAKLGEDEAALAICEEGLAQHPSYRPLRAFRIFAKAKAKDPSEALVDALELMLESLAPSRWDVFEDEIRGLVADLRTEPASSSAKPEPSAADEARPFRIDVPPSKAAKTTKSAIQVDGDEASGAEYEVSVQVSQTSKSKPARKPKSSGAQFGKKAVRIDISASKDDREPDADAAGKLQIPLDPD